MNLLNRHLVRVEKFVAGTLIACIAICVFCQVFFRYFMASPLAWPDEMSRYLQVWMVFVGAAIATDRLSHFHMDVISQFVPSSLSRYIDLGVLLAMLVFAASVAVFGTRIIEVVHRQFSPAMEVKMSYAYLAMPVGGVLMCWHLVVHLVNKLADTAKHSELQGETR